MSSVQHPIGLARRLPCHAVSCGYNADTQTRCAASDCGMRYSMDKNDIVTLYRYDDWANVRVLRQAALVAPEQYTALHDSK